MYQIGTSMSDAYVGHTSPTLNIDSNGNLYGSIKYMRKALRVFKINTNSDHIDWTTKIGTDSI